MSLGLAFALLVFRREEAACCRSGRNGSFRLIDDGLVAKRVLAFTGSAFVARTELARLDRDNMAFAFDLRAFPCVPESALSAGRPYRPRACDVGLPDVGCSYRGVRAVVLQLW